MSELHYVGLCRTAKPVPCVKTLHATCVHEEGVTSCLKSLPVSQLARIAARVFVQFGMSIRADVRYVHDNMLASIKSISRVQ